MNKILLAATAAVGLLCSVVSYVPQAAEPLPTAVAPAPERPEGRGCCSWHGGQCGCSGERVLCCDGTLSPTCVC
jgi:hypothetical protein